MRRAALMAAVVLTGCGSLGGGTGGADDLPNRGVVPYERALLVVSSTTATEPSAVAREDGIELYYEDQGQLLLQRSPDAIELEPPEMVLEGVRSPAVVFAGGVYHLVFASEDRSSILHAQSDDGVQFGEPSALLTQEAPFETAAVDSPSLVIDDGDLVLFYAATDSDGSTRIARAHGPEGTQLGDHRIVLEPGEGCLDTDGEVTPCWDADAVDHPEVHQARTATGRTVYRLLYTGAKDQALGIGFAASFDGLDFERFQDNPIVGDTSVAESQPSNALYLGRYLLYHREVGDDGAGIALRINDEGVPSELLNP